jgi:hypothetical protein
MARVPRDLSDLVGRLRSHVKLLREYYGRAFRDGDLDYMGEIAGKLRLLTSSRGRNKPLLSRLMKMFGVEVLVTLDGPPIKRPGVPGPGDQISIERFLGLFAFGFKARSGDWVELTKADLIEDWAAQHGSAHEDWEFTEPFATAMQPFVIAFGLPEHAHELRATAKAVIHAAETFLAQITPERIAEVARQVPDTVDPRGPKGRK